jgi:curved DNA-binding protein CbpA
MEPPSNFDYYAELEVPPTATRKQIVASYVRLFKAHQPVDGPNAVKVAETKFERVSALVPVITCHQYETHDYCS